MTTDHSRFSAKAPGVFAVILVLGSAALASALAFGDEPKQSQETKKAQETKAVSRDRPNEGTAQTPAPAKTLEDELNDIDRLSNKVSAEETAKAVRAIGAREMSQQDREHWARLARETAVRLGDRKWLEELKTIPDSFSLVDAYLILGASAKIRAANFAGAHEDLKKVGDTHRLNEREKRRYDAVIARLAQLEGDAPGERVAVEKLVDHLWLWPRKVCQSCHDNPKDRQTVPMLDVSHLWFGDRFVALMKTQGDAQTVLSAATQTLDSDPSDVQARIRLAFALRALGRERESLEHFRKIPWIHFPDRAEPSPRMLFPFP